LKYYNIALYSGKTIHYESYDDFFYLGDRLTGGSRRGFGLFTAWVTLAVL